MGREVGACISKCAQGFKPKFTAHHENTTTTDFKLSHIGSINVDNLPKDLHERLEAVANLQLKQAMRMDDKAELDSATIAFTTTELDAAICVTGCTLQKGLDKTVRASHVPFAGRLTCACFPLHGDMHLSAPPVCPHFTPT